MTKALVLVFKQKPRKAQEPTAPESEFIRKAKHLEQVSPRRADVLAEVIDRWLYDGGYIEKGGA